MRVPILYTIASVAMVIAGTVFGAAVGFLLFINLFAWRTTIGEDVALSVLLVTVMTGAIAGAFVASLIAGALRRFATGGPNRHEEPRRTHPIDSSHGDEAS